MLAGAGGRGSSAALCAASPLAPACAARYLARPRRRPHPPTRPAGSAPTPTARSKLRTVQVKSGGTTGTAATTATDDCQVALADRDAQLAALAAQLAAANASIAQLQAQLAAAAQRAAAAEAALDTALADAQARAQEADATIATLQDQAEAAVEAGLACQARAEQLAGADQRLAATSAALNLTEQALGQARAQLDACDEQREAAELANGALPVPHCMPCLD